MNYNYTYGTARQLLPRCREVFANCVRFNLHRELAITLVARKFSISLQTQNVQAHHATVPGSVAAMLLLPIPVAHPPNKKNPAHRPDYFCGGGAGNRTRVLR
jgi:hypothetical protein